MHLALVEPSVPPVDRRAVPDPRGHLALGAFLQALGLILEGRKVGPDRRQEADAAGVAQPLRAAGPGRHIRQTARLAAARRDHIDLAGLILAALGDEGDERAVRAPGRLGIGRLGGGELACSARPVGRDEVEIREALVLLDVEPGHRHDRHLAVRRQRGLADAGEVPHGFGRQRPALGQCGSCSAHGENGDGRQQTTEHGQTPRRKFPSPSPGRRRAAMTIARPFSRPYPARAPAPVRQRGPRNWCEPPPRYRQAGLAATDRAPGRARPRSPAARRPGHGPCRSRR
jgi:hypothetical protein